VYAIGVTSYGDPDQLHPIRLPDPAPARGEVRIRVQAAGVNPVDAMVRDGSLAAWFGSTEPPYIPGMDVAGVVDAVGDGVDEAWNLEIGKDVIAVVNNFGAYGGYSQLITVPATSVVPRPANLSVPEAGSFLMNALTAQSTLDALPPADEAPRLIVAGAAGAVGANVVALAAREEREVTAVAAPGDAVFLAGLGATRTVRASDVQGGADALVDTAGIAAELVDHVVDGGNIVVIQPGIPRFERDVTVTHISVRDRIDDRAAIARLVDLAADGTLPVRVARVLPAREAPSAHALLARRGTRGRFVLDFTTDLP
jgi:NADPH2:quinone reductase